jgi:cytosine permease
MADHSLEDFARQQVPQEKTVSGLRIALIVVGIMITLPAFLTSAQVGQALGLIRGATAIGAGSVILASFGCLIAVVGARSRLSTYMIIQFPFGRTGAKVVSMVIGITLLGWFGVNGFLFGQAVQSSLSDLFAIDSGMQVPVAFGSILVIATTVYGFRALDRLAVVSVPILLTALIAIVYFATHNTSMDEFLSTEGTGMTMGIAISAVVGAFMVGLTLLPDLCRYAHDSRHGVIASCLSFAVGYPLVLIVSAIPALATGESDFMLIMMGLGMGVSAMLILVFATWTTNISNLYSTSLLLATVFTRIDRWKLTIGAGIIGTVFAGMGILDHFVSFLLFLGIAIPPIAGIYVADFFFVRGQDYDTASLRSEPPVSYPAFIAWVGASAVAQATASEVFTMTSIPSCDAILVSFGLYLFLRKGLGIGTARAAP